MKKQVSIALVCAALIAVLLNFSSCEKDKGTPPNIAFLSTAGYTNADATLAVGSQFVVGILTTPSESGDVVKTLNVSKSINGAADATVKTTTIPTAQQNSYTEIDTFTVGSVHAQTERYTFTVTNRDGITNNVKLTITDN